MLLATGSSHQEEVLDLKSHINYLVEIINMREDQFECHTLENVKKLDGQHIFFFFNKGRILNNKVKKSL